MEQNYLITGYENLLNSLMLASTKLLPPVCCFHFLKTSKNPLLLFFVFFSFQAYFIEWFGLEETVKFTYFQPPLNFIC